MPSIEPKSSTNLRDVALCCLAAVYIAAGLWLTPSGQPLPAREFAILACLPLLVSWTRELDQRVDRPWTAIFRACWPVVAAPVAYLAEVRILELERSRYFDAPLAAADRWLGLYRGDVPAWTLGGGTEEAANLLYASYYLIPVIVVVLATRATVAEAARATTALTLASLGCGLVWLIVPSGGYFLGGSPQGLAAGPFSWLVHRMYASYPHYAAAFPSEHVAHAVALAVVLQQRSRWFWAWAAGIAIATVVGQYHYGLDPVAGALLGIGAGKLALRPARAQAVAFSSLAPVSRAPERARRHAARR
jgi:membrane-associated phospholipid phosphatase